MRHAGMDEAQAGIKIARRNINNLRYADDIPFLPSVHSFIFLNGCLVDLGFPGGSDGRESSCNVEDLGSIPGLGRSPGVGHGNALQYSCLENPHGQRSLAGSMGLKKVRCNWATKHKHTVDLQAVPISAEQGWLRFTYIYIPFFFKYSFPLWFIPGDIVPCAIQ